MPIPPTNGTSLATQRPSDFTTWGVRSMLKPFGLGRQTPLAYLLPLRLFFGAYFIMSAWGKLRGRWLGRPVAATQAQFTATPVLATILDQFAHANPYPPYKAFLLQVVIPRAEAFRHLIVFGELAIGMSLFLGILTRLGALFGIFANLNYLLMKGLQNERAGIDEAFIVGLLVSLLTNPGKVLGIDFWLHRKWPRVPFW